MKCYIETIISILFLILSSGYIMHLSLFFLLIPPSDTKFSERSKLSFTSTMLMSECFIIFSSYKTIWWVNDNLLSFYWSAVRCPGSQNLPWENPHIDSFIALSDFLYLVKQIENRDFGSFSSLHHLKIWRKCCRLPQVLNHFISSFKFLH